MKLGLTSKIKFFYLNLFLLIKLRRLQVLFWSTGNILYLSIRITSKIIIINRQWWSCIIITLDPIFWIIYHRFQVRINSWILNINFNLLMWKLWFHYWIKVLVLEFTFDFLNVVFFFYWGHVYFLILHQWLLPWLKMHTLLACKQILISIISSSFFLSIQIIPHLQLLLQPNRPSSFFSSLIPTNARYDDDNDTHYEE